MSTLEIRDLHVSVANSDATAEPLDLLKGVDLTVRSGETHAIMGPNGSGKSTLSYAIAGHPKYTVTSGTIPPDGAAGPLRLSPQPSAPPGMRGDGGESHDRPTCAAGRDPV